MVLTSTGIGSVLEELERLVIQSGLTVPQDVQLELRFLNMFTCCLATREEASKDISLASLLFDVEAILKEARLLTVIDERKAEYLNCLCSSLLEKIEHFKPKIREICAVQIDSSKSKSCSSDGILECIGCLVGNLKDLVELKADIVVPLKNQIMVLQAKLSFLRNLVDFTAKRCSDHQKLEDFLDYVKDWVHKAACLSLLCWLDGKDEMMAQRLENMIFDLLQKTKPYTPEAKGIFVRVLKASKSSRSDKLLVGQIVAGLVDIFLEDLDDPLKKDYVEILREGLIFMITFFMDPLEDAVTNAENRVSTQVNAAIEEVLSIFSSLYVDEFNVDISVRRETDLSSFRSKFDKVKAEVGALFVQVPNSSDFNFPMTNGTGFIDFFLENLKQMLECFPSSILFAKHQVMIIEKELLLLKAYLKDIVELQNEIKEIKDLWKRILNVVYLAEHVIASCSVADYPIWYDMLLLSNVIEAIKLMENEVKKFDELIFKIRTTSTETSSSHLRPTQANISRLEEVVVGLKDESGTIISRLTRGTKHLDIVSVVGMPGLGKTTLAKKVYNDPSVKYYFHKCAWCCVSQTYKSRDIMLDILSDLSGFDTRGSESNTSDEDLAEKLWNVLKGRRYIIVMDDIWNIEAWESIKVSFPDDNNGSRIMFTSRIHDLFHQAKPDCSPDYPLRPLSDEESWELLQEKLFHKDRCPPDLLEIGKNIAKNCKGLPLAVVLVAGILAKTSKNIDWWKQIEQSTSMQIASEGCMDVLELSYKHLPDSLKSCFLYFGAFPEDKVVRARKLMNLWIAEGLVPLTEKKSLYETAEDCLTDLIGRSLVILVERSSKGGVKSCRVHDLLRDLCLEKIQEDKFLHWVHGFDVSHSSSKPEVYDKYRLCVDAEWKQFIDSNPAVPHVHSLILFGNYTAGILYPHSSTFFSSFKLLNVLDLECIYIDCTFPEEITFIIHLRYLAIYCRATKLPSSIANLWNLETLIVRSSIAEIPLPITIWQMKRLRQVCIPSMCLTGLEHHEYGRLEFMDLFSTPILNSGKETEELLKRLPGLRKLNCKFIERQFNNKPYKFPELSRLNGLESLKVFSYGLVLFGEKRDQFPAFDFPSSLRRLTLGRFAVPWRAISTIGQLPNLEVLKLQDRAFSGKKWDMEEGEFPNLKFLELWNLNFEQWTVPDEPFPCLQQLAVKNCYSLEGIPLSLGFIPTLKKIEMRWCFEASSSARQILEEQKEMGNDVLEVIVFG